MCPATVTDQIVYYTVGAAKSTAERARHRPKLSRPEREFAQIGRGSCDKTLHWLPKDSPGALLSIVAPLRKWAPLGTLH